MQVATAKKRAHLLREALVALAGAPSLSARGGHIPRRINSKKMLEGMLVKGKSSRRIPSSKLISATLPTPSEIQPPPALGDTVRHFYSLGLFEGMPKSLVYVFLLGLDDMADSGDLSFIFEPGFG